MKKKILGIVLVGIIALAGIYHMASAQAVTNEVSALSGTVSWTAQPGATVQEGNDLVRIETMTGSTAACRASADGVVKEVLVSPGQMIKSGQIVARIVVQ
ncbi:biotin/lipoyl-containing protein [Pectinatus frisingensis]|jgi:biotin carboxyl carrier protein|uniref:biotin/lipoyl-containing protein n=1 Tax=Pectinatus frisingensis TaxID=865 RepID=UPI0015F62391|nr:biotin/lipoyl-containing protein [Pectinatus frisingensis]